MPPKKGGGRRERKETKGDRKKDDDNDDDDSDVDVSSAAEANAKRVAKKREKKMKPARQKAPVPPVLSVENPSISLPEAPEVLRIEDLATLYAHMEPDITIPDRCKGLPPGEGKGGEAKADDDETPGVPINAEAAHIAERFRCLPTPRLSMELGGRTATHEELTTALLDARVHLAPLSAQEESEQLGECGTWKDIGDGRERVYEPCAAGDRCWGMRFPFKMRPNPETAMPSMPSPFPQSENRSSVPSTHPISRWAMIAAADDVKRAPVSRWSTIGVEESKTPRPPVLPVSSSSPAPVRRILAAFKSRAQYRHFMETGATSRTSNYCILCYRANITDIVLTRRGNPGATVIPHGTIIQYTRSLPDRPGGYRSEFLLKKQPDCDDGLVDCVPQWRPNLLYWYIAENGRAMIDQSAMVWQEPVSQAPRMGETLADF